MVARALLAGPLVLAACSRAAPPTTQVTQTHLTTDARCLDCHAEIVRSYRETGMARALGPVLQGELAVSDWITWDDAGWGYRFEEAASGPRIIEGWSDGSSPLRGTFSSPLVFAIGAGLMDRSYAARLGDLLWFAPLEVVRHGEERRAALAPGHSIRPGTRFTIPIEEECLACHTDQLPSRGYPSNLAPEPVAWSPAGISCAACHGDVEGHAAWRERSLAGEAASGPDPVVTASRAGAIESLSLCARCHLQGDASLLLEPLARGVLPAGGDITTRRAVFVAANPTQEIGFVSQVERLVRSRCFIESMRDESRAFTCLTCHDPHRSSFDPRERAIVRGRCTECHPSGDSGGREKSCSLPVEKREGQDCAQCHMRRTPVFDVASVEIHDHWIQRSPGPPSRFETLRVKETKDGKLALFTWTGRDPPAHAQDPGLWMMANVALGRADLAQPYAEREPGPVSDRLPTYHHLRAVLLESASHLESARAALAQYERALALDPDASESAVNLGALLGRLGKHREGIALLDRWIALHPKAEGALRNRGVLKLQLGDRAGFATDLEAAHAILPQAAVARALAQHWRQAGRADLAERWQSESLRLDPSQR